MKPDDRETCSAPGTEQFPPPAPTPDLDPILKTMPETMKMAGISTLKTMILNFVGVDHAPVF
jgi:hypothetical protein